MDALLISLSEFMPLPAVTSHGFGAYVASIWRVETDRGIPELFGYVKELSAAAALYGCFRHGREVAYAGWSLAFLSVFLDDALQLHEVFGRLLLAHGELPAVFSVDAKLYSESVFWLLVGLPLGVWLGRLYIIEPSTRHLSRRLFVLFVFLLAFAGIADGVHAYGDTLTPESRFGAELLTLLEDGGEMIALSCLTAYVLVFARSRFSVKLWRV